MIPRQKNKTRSTRRGFTLVEILVVIVIIAVLAAVTFSVTRRIQQSAQASNRLSNMRQAGSMLLGIASENNGRCSYFAGGSSTAWEHRPYLILLKELGLTNQKDYNVNEANRVKIMHWDLEKLPPVLPHWNCRAINFQNVTYPDGTATKWTQEEYIDPYNGRKANLKSISLASISRPGSYPMLIDSSTSDGREIFRINEGNGDCVGLREAGGKASAFMFDGSARHMDKADLKKAGFTKAFDNSTTPPKSVNL
jgi:prepilin-type N-terminal cleavage/methylation domain-containing protein